MEFRIRGILVEVDVLESLDGRGWTFSRGIFLSDGAGRGKAKHLPVLGDVSLYPTKEAAITGARLWAESMIEQGIAPQVRNRLRKPNSSPAEALLLGRFMLIFAFMWYLLLKLVHVLAAVVAVGANATYGVWIATGSRDPKVLPFALRGVKLIDDRIANPAYGLLLITGIALVLIGKIPITTPWLLIALILYVLVVLVGMLGYTPTLKKQIQILDSAKAAAGRALVLGIVLAVLAVAIIFFMVVKPSLWS
jgi:uncharacterized membrane protein